MNAEPEVWKPVPGFTDVFASSLGYIKRRDFRCGPKSKGIPSADRWIINCGAIDGRGYRILSICCSRKLKVHRLVALAFHPNPHGLPEVNHKNGIKTDNRPENLEWCDRGHNNRHALANRLRVAPCGEHGGGSKLKEWQVRQIFSDVNHRGMSARLAGLKHGISRSWARQIAIGNFWKHLNLAETTPCK